MIHILLPIECVEWNTPHVLFGQTEVMQIEHLLCIVAVLHQEQFDIRGNRTRIYLCDDAVLRRRSIDLLLIQRIENGEPVHGIDAHRCKKRIQKTHPGQDVERYPLALCRRAQKLYRALRDVRASGDEIEDRPRADTRTEIRDNRRV